MKTIGRWTLGASLTALVLLVPVGSAAAHPLGNFSVNHLNRLTIDSTSIVDDVIIDIAEIPTAQTRSEVDTDGDGAISDAERRAHADIECAAFADSATVSVDDGPLSFDVAATSFGYEEGQAGLETSRLECRLVADVAVDDLGDDVHRVEFTDGYQPGRIGWYEINAVGGDVGIVDSPVPTSSVTNGLRSYPEDLLASPLDVREVAFDVGPGGVTQSDTDDTALVDADDDDTAADARDSLVASRPGALGGFVDGIQDTFDDMVGRNDLTLGVGLLAIGLALILGASHALLPGHGKTVMAAYIAGRQGSARDAVLVGVTVTATHTGGVLLLGLGLTLSTALAGETVLSWLGVASGLLIAALGLALLVNAVRRRETTLFGHGHSHGPGGHTHGSDGHVHDHDDHAESHHIGGQHAATDGHPHDDHHHQHDGDGGSSTVVAAQATTTTTTLLAPDHDHTRHDHDHTGHDHDHDHDHDHTGHDRDPGEHEHEHEHDDDHGGHVIGPDPVRVSRSGLVGMGVAGGLVPSPSALIVLLSAIALGRTWFGIVLVIGYGAGMAIVLTLAGVLLVKVRDRYQDRVDAADGKVARSLKRWGRLAPFLTAALVVAVGIGLAVRSFLAF